MEADIASQGVGLASNTDFSIIKLFIRADIIVKSVIILLIAGVLIKKSELLARNLVQIEGRGL